MEYGLIGAKLGHSFSRRIHESMWCDDYALLELDEAQAQAFFRRLHSIAPVADQDITAGFV